MAIEIKQVSKSYAGRRVLDRFSAALPAHETTVIMGPSGCGKTTLLRLLMGLERPDAGQIDGLPDKISAVFQEERLCRPFSALANVRLVTGKSVSRQIIAHHLAEIGLSGSILQPVRTLSGGQQRRVSIVRAMLADSDLILLDEPFKGLDADTKNSVLTYVKSKAEGKTLLVVTHDAAEATALAPVDSWIRMPAIPAD
ncbi:MAG: ATP-binding cassette domain-containing protein [Eubacteriales bacterium]|nr:ATP-binding cassette domain-containing protein [Eubacteriales bacterium]